MRKLLAIVSILFYIYANAQTVQKGLVKEYNEKAQKTPLAGVELNVRSAGNTVSDENGNFLLNFLTLKAGEKVNVRRIEKLGYELFNKEAVEQWNLNPTNPFVIVMCRSERFKKIRDNYERVSSDSYDRQMRKEMSAIAKLKEEGKLKEAEYQKKLREIQENYENQIDNINNYIDRFSRIDLSELSSVEQEIIELIQQGNIDAAITKYEEQNLVEKYQQEVSDIKEITQAIDTLTYTQSLKIQNRDSLLSIIDRQVETFRLAGGKANFDRIESILHDVAYSDTTTWLPLYKYGDFLLSQNKHESAISVFLLASNVCPDVESYIKNQIKLCEANYSKSNFKEAMDIISSLLSYKDIPDELSASLYYTLGSVLFKSTRFAEAEDAFSTALDYVKNSGNRMESMIYFTLSSLNRTQKKFKEAIEYNALSLNILKDLAATTESKIYDDEIIKCNGNEAKILYYSGDKTSSLEKFKDLHETYTALYNTNPEKYGNMLAWNDVMLAMNYRSLDMYDDALSVLDRASAIYSPLYEKSPLAYGKSYCSLLEEYGINHLKKDSFEKADSCYKQAISIASLLYTYDDISFRSLYIHSLYAYAYMLYGNNKYEEALNIFRNAIELSEPLYKENPTAYGELYSSNLMFAGDCQAKLLNYEEAIKLLTSSLEIRKELYRKGQGITALNLAENYRALASALTNSEIYDSALENLQKAYELYSEICKKAPKYKKHALAMQRNMAAIYSEIYKDYEKAHAAVDIALSYSPLQIDIWEQKGILYLNEDRLADARNIMNKIMEIDPTYGSTGKSEFIDRMKISGDE